MATEVGYAALGIIPSFDGFEKNLERGAAGPLRQVGDSGGQTFGDAAGKSAGKRFGSVFKKAAKAGLVGIGALGVGAFALAKDAVGLASDLEESTNKVNQVFGKGADSILKFSAQAADALGQTNTAARDAASTFGLFGNLAGLTDKKSAKFAKRMTVLASDLASFHNTEPDQAVQALGAALRGESEPIRSYGVLLDEATLKAEAMSLGLLKPVKDKAKIQAYQVAILEGQQKYNEAVKEHGKESVEALKAEANLGTARDRLAKATEGTIPPLTQQQKVLAAQSSIFKQTEVAQGDFARTSDGLANQQRRLSARFEDAKARLGTGLLPIMTDAADFLLDKGIPAFEGFSDWFNEKGLPAIKNFADDMKPLAETTLSAAGDALGAMRDALRDAAPFAQDMVDAFRNMPGWAQKALTGGALAGLAGKKIKDSLPIPGGIGGRGLGGGIIRARGNTPAFPMYVSVVGKGGLDPDGGGKKGGVLATAGKVFGVAAAAAILGGLATAGIKGLSDKVAPKATDKGIWGTPRNTGFDGLLDDMDQGKTKAEALTTSVDKLDRKAKQMGPYRIGLEVPQLNPLFSRVQQFGSILDGLDGRHIQIYVDSKNSGPAGGLGASNRSGTDSGEPSARFGGTTHIYNHNGNVVAPNPREYETWRRNKSRAHSGGGR